MIKNLLCRYTCSSAQIFTPNMGFGSRGTIQRWIMPDSSNAMIHDRAESGLGSDTLCDRTSGCRACCPRQSAMQSTQNAPSTRKIYHQYKIRQDMPTKIKCSHILVEKQSQAMEVLARIKNGDKFGKLARELSIDSGSAKRDGNLGYFSRGRMVKQFEAAAFGLQVGEVSQPVKTEFGYHVIKRFG